jgi:hypothetical protein
MVQENALTLTGDCMLAAGFVSYVGAFDQDNRGELWRNVWTPDIVQVQRHTRRRSFRGDWRMLDDTLVNMIDTWPSCTRGLCGDEIILRRREDIADLLLLLVSCVLTHGSATSR